MSWGGRARARRSGRSGVLAAGLVGSFAIHAAAAAVLVVGAAASRRSAPPVYSVSLVAAPAPDPAARPAPEAVDRPAEPKQPTVPTTRTPPRNTASREAPPNPPDAQRREAAPRTTAREGPLPGETPSTGTDVATVKTEGAPFSHPEYLNNIVAQILKRWQRPVSNTPLQAELFFLIRRDGSVADISFVRRSGSFAFDLEAQGAIEAAGRARAFGPLPEDYAGNVLPVSFFFTPRTGVAR